MLAFLAQIVKTVAVQKTKIIHKEKAKHIMTSNVMCNIICELVCFNDKSLTIDKKCKVSILTA